MAGTALRSPCGGDGQKIRSRGAAAGTWPRPFPASSAGLCAAGSRGRVPRGWATAAAVRVARVADPAGRGWRRVRNADMPRSSSPSSTAPPRKPFDGPRRPVPRSPVRPVRVALRRGRRHRNDAAPRIRCSVPDHPEASPVRTRLPSPARARGRSGLPGRRGPGAGTSVRALRAGRPAHPVRRGPGSGPRRRGSSPAPAAGAGTADGARTPGRVAVRSPFTCMAHRSRAARGSRPRSNPGRPRTPGRPSHHPAQSPDRTGTDDAPLGPPGPEGDA